MQFKVPVVILRVSECAGKPVMRIYQLLKAFSAAAQAGIRVMMVAANKLEDPDKMKVEKCNEMVQTALVLTGLGDLLLDAD